MVLQVVGLSFPKIISGRIGDAAQPGSEWRKWRQIVGPLDARVHPSVMPSLRDHCHAVEDELVLPHSDAALRCESRLDGIFGKDRAKMLASE
jgi:hypothetical protein